MTDRHTSPTQGEALAEERYIYRPWIRDRNGRKRWARDYGKKAWRIPISD